MNFTFLFLLILIGFLLLGFIINKIIDKKFSEWEEKSKPSAELLEYLRTTNSRLDEQTRHLVKL